MQSPHSLRVRSAVIPALVLAAMAPSLRATNGMNMEGYGPVATALGGASFAFDNGTAAVMNNPATLSLMPQVARLDVALGVLGPDISATNPAGQVARSRARAFFMPALGYVRRSGAVTYGLGLFGQGGMGCEYDANSWRGLGFGLENRTEVSVGRLIAPVSWRVNEKLSLAATADFVWAGMDLRMAMSGTQFFDLVMPTSQQFGRASGTIVQRFGQIMQMMPAGTAVDYAYFDFSNGNPFTGKAQGYGYAGKVGLVYQAAPEVAFGLTYHARTALADLKDGAAVSFQLNAPGLGQVPQKLTGDIRVRDFEWPAMIGAGFAWDPQGPWSFVADVRRVLWSEVMDSFRMAFTASGSSANGSFAGQTLDAELFQNWKDQTTVQVGASYVATSDLTLRFGANLSSNPIPDRYLNCLFPATIEKHFTAGFSYRVAENSTIDWSATYGFEVNRTNGYGIAISHRQINSQVMFSHRF
ncbi:MAG: OmpP1/FadL family transporter [Verrucomicrobiota bacterium]